MKDTFETRKSLMKVLFFASSSSVTGWMIVRKNPIFYSTSNELHYKIQLVFYLLCSDTSLMGTF